MAAERQFYGDRSQDFAMRWHGANRHIYPLNPVSLELGSIVML